MPIRMIREQMLESERYHNLTSDTARLAFVHFILKADDLGNCEATNLFLRRNIFLTNISNEAATKILCELADEDLIRIYEIDAKRYVHIPRFRQRMRHVKRVNPRPPKNIECNEIKELISKTSDESQTQDSRTPPEVKRSEEKRSEEKEEKAFVSQNDNQNQTPSPDQNSTLIGDSTESIAPASEKPKAKRKKDDGITFSEYLDKLGEGAQFINADDTIYEWCENAGIDLLWLQLHYQEFKESHTTGSRSGARYKDWKATFRNSVKKPWYELWAFGRDGGAFLTNKGKAAMNVFQNQQKREVAHG